ncbi:hypothetical protein C0J52_17111 [Blattella germanica]|nr:hypothetical protein C0J52_17111 [Blattella germanica]
MAAFFSGQWKLKFEQELTNNEEFTYVNGTIGNVSTMHMEKDLSAGHITEIGAKFVLLPFSVIFDKDE